MISRNSPGRKPRYEDLTEVGLFIEEAELFEAHVQIAGKDVDIAIKDHIEDYSVFFQDFILSNLYEIENYIDNHGEVIGYFLDYLASYITENELTWYEYPCIIDSNTFNNFLRAYKKYGRDKALEEYKSHIKTAKILCKTGEPDTDIVLEVMGRFIDIHGDRYDEKVLSIDYYDQYPVKPIRKGIRLLKNDLSHNFIRVIQKYKKYDLCLYSKGIRVQDKSISLQYAIEGIRFESIILDLKSDRYGLDVARNSFDANVKDDIEKTLACAVYSNLMGLEAFSIEEKQLIAKFLNVYYDKNS